MYFQTNLAITIEESKQFSFICKEWKKIYSCDFPAKLAMSHGKYIALIYDEALFDDFDKGRDAITHILMSLAQNYSNLSFDCELCQLFEVNEFNSSPGRLTKYSYSDNTLTIGIIEGDHDKIWTCVDCAPDVCTQEPLNEEKPILTLYDYDPKKKYTCPACGCDMHIKDKCAEFGDYIMPYYEEHILSFVDGHWVLLEGFKISDDFGELNEGFEWKHSLSSKAN